MPHLVNDTQVDDAQDIDIVMVMYNLIEYRGIYSKTLGTLWQHYIDELALNNNKNVIDFSANNKNNVWFKFKN